jgi:CheY-like chemotaxis protein
VYNTRERNGMTESGGVHILVVDDEEGIREAFADLLADKGYEVSLAADGKQALEICHARQAPDLIFVDLMMPVMDGAEFIRVKDADPELSHVPVCVMTAFAGSARIPATTALVLRKPLGSADLFAVVKRFCRPARPVTSDCG